MFLALVLLQTTSQGIVTQTRDRIERADTIIVTVTQVVEEFPKPVKTKWWYRKGGYYRYESPKGTFIASPEKSWSYRSASEKAYMAFPGAQTDWSLSRETGLGGVGDLSQLPPIGIPMTVEWRGRRVVRIQIDGTKKMTPETKLYYFFDPATHNPVGISANLGSMTQVTEFADLQINPKIDDTIFKFVPPKDWKLVTGG